MVAATLVSSMVTPLRPCKATPSSMVLLSVAVTRLLSLGSAVMICHVPFIPTEIILVSCTTVSWILRKSLMSRMAMVKTSITNGSMRFRRIGPCLRALRCPQTIPSLNILPIRANGIVIPLRALRTLALCKATRS